MKVNKLIIIILLLVFTGCKRNSINKNEIYLDFPFKISVDDIPDGWFLKTDNGYILYNANIKKIILDDEIIRGNFSVTVASYGPFEHYIFCYVSFKVDSIEAIDIWDKILQQKIVMYDISYDNRIKWLDLSNDLEYYYNPGDSVFIITYLTPLKSDPQNRRNKLKKRLKK